MHACSAVINYTNHIARAKECWDVAGLKKNWKAPLCWQGPLKAISVFIGVKKQGSSDFRIAQPLWDRMEEGGLHLHDWRAEGRFTGPRKSTCMICIANCPVYGVQQYLIALCAQTSRVEYANYIKPVTVSSMSGVKILDSTLKTGLFHMRTLLSASSGTLSAFSTNCTYVGSSTRRCLLLVNEYTHSLFRHCSLHSYCSHFNYMERTDEGSNAQEATMQRSPTPPNHTLIGI